MTLKDFHILKLLLSALILSVITTCAYSQCDTIVIYTVADSTEQFVVIPCDSDSTSTYGEILGNVGSMGNITQLLTDSASVPFTPLALAENDYNLLSYPVRTNLALVWSDSIVEQGASCSGTLISSNIALTAGHCIGTVNSFDEFIWKGGKGLYVSPSHVNGFPQNLIGKIKVTHIIILKKFYNNSLDFPNDYALLVLEDPVGSSIGWMGLSYHQNDSILNSTMVSYNFGYPATSGYNGKDMFYNYGIVVTNFFWGEFNNGVPGITGQSGSCFFYVDGNKYLMYGIYVFSTTNDLFTKNRVWEIQKMMDHASTLVSVPDLSITKFSLVNVFPNPMNQTAVLTLDTAVRGNNSAFSIDLYDISGLLVMRESLINCCEYELQKGNLESGLYTVLVYDSKSIIGTTKIVVN
ncbi:MAG: trypsin-like serine protease [Cytophagales bacterium]|nr:trypsin-like serine protease [Cytophagales bacterium]